MQFTKKHRQQRKRLTLRRKVEKFMECDINTVLAPGKKDTITRGKIKKQKRYLTDSLKSLHLKFKQESGEKISYTIFCKYKPFWCVTKKVTERDTCACKLHENVNFRVKKLKQEGILQNECDVNRMVTCSDNNFKCMYNECEQCKNKHFDVPNDYDRNKKVSFFSWENRCEEYEKNGTKHKVQKTVKIVNETTLEDVVKETESIINEKFTKHIFNINHQYLMMKSLRESLPSNPSRCLVHIDFSENFACKFSDEIQGLHFGGSRNQVSIHTGVLYMTDEVKSFASISEDMRHGPAAIWAHLAGILEYVKGKGITEVHFLSDGPTTQYRSKGNFYLFHHFIHNKYGMKMASWNFSESGHGKGAAVSGVGGLLKRSADELVARGVDIPNADSFFNELSKLKLDLTLFKVTSEAIDQIANTVPTGLKEMG